MSPSPSPPGVGAGALLVWLRNATVWRRSWRTSLVGTLGEPLFYFLGLGYGLGTLIPPVNGRPYLHFVAPGLMLSSAMYSSTIEATYNTFTKMEHQRVFASMVLSPLELRDILLGEVLWAATKGLMSGTAVLVLALLFGVGKPWPGGLGVVLIAAAGVIFASLGLLVTSTARSYDSFNYYFTLVVTPMFFFSGIFFPVAALGKWVAVISWCLPLTHLVNVSRALAGGWAAPGAWGDVLWVSLFALGSLWCAVAGMSWRFAR